ncbi:MAG: STAS domain-containing protein [Thermoguttaceae bacterium]
MIRVDTQQGVTIIELGSAYESLDDDALEEIGGLILTKATAVEPPWMVLDLSGTRYIGSTFIELMVRAWKRLRQRGGNMVLCGVQPFCAEVLRTTKLDTIWTVAATREEALAHAVAGRQTSEAADGVVP